MKAGALRHRLTLQRAGETMSPKGSNVTKSWTEVDIVAARVSPVSGRERREASATVADVTHEIEIRHRDDVTPKMRGIYDGRTFNIESVIRPDERRIRLLLQCKEVV